jgi:cytochrome c oxidase cbb3-type subunit IV
MSYDELRHFADSYGLAAMFAVFIGFALWTFRPGARRHHDQAANMIFTEESDFATSSKDANHG